MGGPGDREFSASSRVGGLRRESEHAHHIAHILKRRSKTPVAKVETRNNSFGAKGNRIRKLRISPDRAGVQSMVAVEDRAMPNRHSEMGQSVAAI